jgi:hypothetical protein
VIDDISKDIKKYLINMEVQSISKSDLLKLATGFEDPEVWLLQSDGHGLREKVCSKQ